MFVIRQTVVARSLARLRAQKTHTLFAGYLYLQKRASELDRLTDLQPEFSSFFKYFLLVGNPPLRSPTSSHSRSRPQAQRIDGSTRTLRALTRLAHCAQSSLFAR